MKNKFNRGFTLIELLVVIAIIGILSSVVLASLNTARNKGADAAVKSNLNNMRAQAELFYDNNGNSYTGVCADPSFTKALEAARLASGATTVTTVFATAQTGTSVACQAQSTSWVIQSPLKTSGHWCVDSSGNSKTEVNVLGGSSAACA